MVCVPQSQTSQTSSNLDAGLVITIFEEQIILFQQKL